MTREERRQRNTLAIELIWCFLLILRSFLLQPSIIRWLTIRTSTQLLCSSKSLGILTFNCSAFLPYHIYLKTLIISYCILQVHSVSQLLLGWLIKLACELQLQRDTPKSLVTIDQHTRKTLLFVFIRRFTYKSQIKEQLQNSAVRLPTKPCKVVTSRLAFFHLH